MPVQQSVKSILILKKWCLRNSATIWLAAQYNNEKKWVTGHAQRTFFQSIPISKGSFTQRLSPKRYETGNWRHRVALHVSDMHHRLSHMTTDSTKRDLLHLILIIQCPFYHCPMPTRLFLHYLWITGQLFSTKICIAEIHAQSQGVRQNHSRFCDMGDGIFVKYT